ncbi:hydroxyethylthiazole kinase [Vibrio zhugei]|uniref:Hydroxyethylthiazole kinase n=1 Tax=Vibrio zhugei TaxID=2479546 RepID=A0ABV7CCQ5_9VIBR|nr:hydroxyethylthiazole kinase [Vibrio zhugei]
MISTFLIEQVTQALAEVRKQKPLVVNITNFVVMNTTANALLALGASPIMAHSRLEMSEMMSHAGALVVNIGTLDHDWIARMHFAVEQANRHAKPVVLDPVGCGASAVRTETSKALARLADRLIIRGNASEIIALASEQANSKGVDVLDSSEAALQAARALVAEYAASVVISGEVDYVVTQDYSVQLKNGHALMPYVTGMGCTLTALTSAFAAISEHAGVAAAAILGVAGEVAAQRAQGPGSFPMALLDELYRLDDGTLTRHLKLQVV